MGISCLPYLLLLALMIVVILFKSNYHIDEIWSYGMTNNYGSNYIEIKDGVKYDSPEDLFINYLTVNPEHRFDYNMVWSNQAKDVHPPLYHTILHTICSFFPGRFSRWFAGSVNIIFALATLFVFRKLVPYFCTNPVFKEILSLGFVVSAGVLSNVSFFRMYVMAMFWVTTLSYLFVSRIGKDFDWKFCLKLFVVVILGALTHYYCIVFAVLISAVYGVYLLVSRQWKNVLLLCGSSALAAVVSYLVFPSMVFHMFSGYRGREALENLNNISDFLRRLGSFYRFINKDLFAGYLTVIIVAFLLLFIAMLLKSGFADSIKQLLGEGEQLLRYVILLIPIGIYYLMVSKMAAFVLNRYVFPIYAVTFLVGITLLINIFERCMPEKSSLIVSCALVGVISVVGLQRSSWDYLYLGTRGFLETSSQYADVDCICIYDASWKVHPMFVEVQKYKSITFVNKDNTELLDKLIKENDKPVILSVVMDDVDPMQYVNMYLEKSDNLTSSTRILKHFHGTTYYLN